MTQCCIIMPLYNDWPSAEKLIGDIDRVIAGWDRDVTVLVINDGSRERLAEPADLGNDCRHVRTLSIVELVCNQGHQRAIAIGLAYAQSLECFESVFVMDSDGEDPPDELNLLREAGRRFPEAIITADRVSRSEGWLFRCCYWCYKLLFRMLTGVSIRFGNFCHIPAGLLDLLVHYPELWNSLSGCIKKSGLPREGIDSHRGKRYFGPSKMSFVSLVLHGLSAISVFKEAMLLRVLLFFAPVTAVAGVAAAVSGATVFQGGASAGVAPALLLSAGLFFALAQVDAILFLLLIHRLSNRAVRVQGPALFWRDYVKAVTRVL
ncbi:MAG: glycosyltransferase [Desulfobacterales bacterium]|nr:glycosyltransferase [Desulfobacterales bacterium]